MQSATALSQPARATRAAVCVLLALALTLAPVPAGVEPAGWRLLGIFLGVIAAFVLQPLAVGPAVLLGLICAALTRSLPGAEAGSSAAMQAALAGYGEKVVWLVVGAFLLAGAVRSTGLGRRVALGLVVRLGRTTLGLGYALAGAELCLAPFVPSVTARGGGIVAPIGQSLARALGSEPHEHPERAGSYLVLVGAHTNLVGAAMFLTGMAANPLVVQAATDAYGIEYGWGRWALGGLLPGLVAMALLPLFLYWIARPQLVDGRQAQVCAREELDAMGSWSGKERVTAGVLLSLLLLWSTKPLHGLDTTLVTWIGVLALALSGARTYGEMLREHRTWDVMLWLGGLLTMANGLKALGVVAWFAGQAGGWFEGSGVLVTALGLALVYFYSMYAFSMLTAHISSMAGAFLAICAASQVPALLAVPLFAIFSNLCACTTNYSTGPVIVWYGLGYVPARRWFQVGALVSLFHLAIWIPLGCMWWRLLGWW